MLRYIAAGLLVLGAVIASNTISVQPVAAAKMGRGCSAGTFHDEVRVGGLCCFAGHEHYGASGPGHKSKDAAMAAAAAAWASFVDFEYGGAYADFRKARGKSFSCNKDAGWACSVYATPCH